MKLAIEKLSPVPPRAIFLNNLDVVGRFTVGFGSALVLAGIIFGSLNVQLPMWAFFLLLGGILIPQVRGIDAIVKGIVLRQLRYSGNIAYARSSNMELESRPWITQIPNWGIRKKFRGELQDKINELLEPMNDSTTFVLFVLGVDDEGNFIPKIYHSCALETCEREQIHARGYDAAKDGWSW